MDFSQLFGTLGEMIDNLQKPTWEWVPFLGNMGTIVDDVADALKQVIWIFSWKN